MFRGNVEITRNLWTRVSQHSSVHHPLKISFNELGTEGNRDGANSIKEL